MRYRPTIAILTHRPKPIIAVNAEVQMTVGYLVNQYPKVSHSFIRREISGLEACGLNVVRFSLRSCAAELVDPEDLAELAKTKVILDQSLSQLLWIAVVTALLRPIAWLRTLGMAIQLSRRCDTGLLKHLAYFVEACMLAHWCRQSRVRHLHAHFGTNPATVAMLCHGVGGPEYSFTVHGPEEFDRAPVLALNDKIEQAKFVVTISSFSRSQLYRQCDMNQWSKIQIIHCGVDQSFLQGPIAEISSRPILVCVARLCEQKGQIVLLRAAKQLADRGIDFELRLVGDGPLRPELEDLICQFGLTRQVVITGWVSGDVVRQHILDARALVLPSFAEGLPVVLMEALALGRPVISTYIAGIPELVETSQNGWLVPAGAEQELAEAMIKVLGMSASELECMGKTGYGKVAQHHDSLYEAKKLAQLLSM
jgi:colanic acid/amylovoran biosynthesis glycosyltransferase